MKHAFADDDLRLARDRLLVRGAELREGLSAWTS